MLNTARSLIVPRRLLAGLGRLAPHGLVSALVGLWLLLGSPETHGAEVSRPPNLVVIFLDDLGYGDIGPFGATKQKTPHLDQMAREGMKLTSFYAAPVCSVSRAQLLTGCYGVRVSVPGVFFPAGKQGLHPQEVTIAERLKPFGYATACIGKWHLGDQLEFLPTRQGFDRYLGIPYSNDMQRKSSVTGQSVVPLMQNEQVAELLTDEQQSTIVERYTTAAVQFIREHQQQPFLLYLPHSAVHTPIWPGAKFRGQSANGRFGDWVEEVDGSVGEILETLRSLKLDQHTLVLFTSDNGPWLVKGADGGSAGPLRGGKGSTWDGGVRVPTIAWWPGKIAPASTSDVVAGTIDLLPTAVALAGGQVPAEPVIDGRDLSPVLLGKSKTSPREAHYYFQGQTLQAIRQGRWKLALTAQPQSMGQPTANDAQKVPRLYDLDRDIGEQRDLADEHPEVVTRLTALAAAMSASIGGDQPRDRRPAGVVEKPVTLYPTEPLPAKAAPKAKAAQQSKAAEKTKTLVKPSAAAAVAPSANFSAAAIPAGKRRPNVLFLMADDLRAEIASDGSPAITPHLTRLARQSVQFERAYCQQAVCNPSRSSLLTGRRPDTLKVWNNSTHFREANPSVSTLPLWFKEHGYSSRCVGKIFHNWHTAVKGDPVSWSAPEFLHYANHGDDVAQVDGPLPPNLARTTSGFGYGKTGICECRDVPDEAYYDGRVAAEAVRVLREVQDQPFFLAVGFWRPHAQFNAPKKYWDLYDRERLPRLDGRRPSDAPELAFHRSTELLGPEDKQHPPSAEQAAEMRHGYWANISYMDAQLGKVLDALEASGVADRTIVTFVSDHGYHIGEHGLWGKTSNFELDARVPMLIRAPGISVAGQRTQALAELLDLFPTLTELCQLPPPDGLEGVSQVPVLRDPTKSVKDAAFTQHPRPAYYDRSPSRRPTAMGVSVRVDGGRYTEWRDWKTGATLDRELYLAADQPWETRNAVNDPQAAGLRALAAAQLARQFPSTPNP